MAEASQLEGKIKMNALTAYLQPLVKKHEMNQELTYEDLTSSWQAVNAVLGKLGQDSVGTSNADLQSAIKHVVRSVHNLELIAGPLLSSDLTRISSASASASFIFFLT